MLQHLISRLLPPSPRAPNPSKRGDQRKRFKVLGELAQRTQNAWGGVVELALPTELQEASKSVYYLFLRPQVFEETSPGGFQRLRGGQGHTLDDMKRLLELKSNSCFID